MSGIALAVIPSQAQFNTVTTMPNRYKVEVVSSNTDTTAVWYGKTAAAQDTPAGNDTSVSSDNIGKKVWVERYLSVCYPLRHIKINSGYGYRKDPLTGKKKFHNGLDLHARGDEVLAMMEGVVVKVGQDKASGKYVTLQHGGYTVSYCHLSQIRTVKGAAVYPRDIVGHYRFDRTQYRRTPAHHLQTERQKCRSVTAAELYKIYAKRMRGGVGRTAISKADRIMLPLSGWHRQDSCPIHGF